MPNDPVHKLSSIVESAKSGNRSSMEALAGFFYNKIFRMVYYRNVSRMDAEDLTQDIFIAMSKNIYQLKDTTRFKAWLYRIALNRIKDFHRKKSFLSFFALKPTEDTESLEGSHNALDDVMKKEFWLQFHGLTRQMSKKEREVFILRYVDQLGIRELAETLKKNESTVKTHLYRALKKFKKAPGLRAFLKGKLI